MFFGLENHRSVHKNCWKRFGKILMSGNALIWGNKNLATKDVRICLPQQHAEPMLVIHIALFSLNNNHYYSPGQQQNFERVSEDSSNLLYIKTKTYAYTLNLLLLYSFHALANASAYRLTAVFPRTLLESNSRSFP